MDFQKNLDYKAYHHWFLMGYQAGFRDGLRNQPSPDFRQLSTVPIEALGLSTRAYHCLHFSGCKTAADVIRLQEQEIQQMRNLGKKTASEIAHALGVLGLQGSHWDLFL